ncbi:hypothetical protein JOQ06_000480, partial [Pogonophryne albipinna]
RAEGKQGGPDGVSRTAGSIQSCCDMLTSLHQQTAASSTYGGRQTKEKAGKLAPCHHRAIATCHVTSYPRGLMFPTCVSKVKTSPHDLKIMHHFLCSTALLQGIKTTLMQALLNGTKLGMLGLGGMEEHQLRPTRQDFKANTISHTHTHTHTPERKCVWLLHGKISMYEKKDGGFFSRGGMLMCAWHQLGGGGGLQERHVHRKSLCGSLSVELAALQCGPYHHNGRRGEDKTRGHTQHIAEQRAHE